MGGSECRSGGGGEVMVEGLRVRKSNIREQNELKC